MTAGSPPRRGLRASAERGQTEVVGVLLLTGVVVVTASLVGVAFFDAVATEDGPTADLDAAVTASALTVSHHGGDALSMGTIEVAVRNETRTWRYSLSPANVTRGDGDERFEPGETWSLRTVPYQSRDVVTVFVVSPSTGTALASNEQVAQPTPVVTTVTTGSAATTTASTTTTSTTATTATTTTATTTTATTTATTTTATTTATTTTATTPSTDDPPVASITAVGDVSDCSRFSGGSGNCHGNANTDVASFEVSWSASDDAGVENVTVALLDSNANRVDAVTYAPGGTSASGTTTLSQQGGYGEQYTVRVTVTDSATPEQTDSAACQETADGSSDGSCPTG